LRQRQLGQAEGVEPEVSQMSLSQRVSHPTFIDAQVCWCVGSATPAACVNRLLAFVETDADNAASVVEGLLMLRGLFRRKSKFDDAKQMDFATHVAGMLELQLVMAGDVSMDNEDGHPKREAIGYVYGFIDAALRRIGQDMADSSISVPVTFYVSRKLWPDRATEYLDFIVQSVSKDDLMMVGVMHGGQQFVDYTKTDDASWCPMGLARFVLKSEFGSLGGRPRGEPLRPSGSREKSQVAFD
jgi:hypothetical protein